MSIKYILPFLTISAELAHRILYRLDIICRQCRTIFFNYSWLTTKCTSPRLSKTKIESISRVMRAENIISLTLKNPSCNSSTTGQSFCSCYIYQLIRLHWCTLGGIAEYKDVLKIINSALASFSLNMIEGKPLSDDHVIESLSNHRGCW
jgi:hypothetical protein